VELRDIKIARLILHEAWMSTEKLLPHWSGEELDKAKQALFHAEMILEVIDFHYK
jgi:hypothetical protein